MDRFDLQRRAVEFVQVGVRPIERQRKRFTLPLRHWRGLGRVGLAKELPAPRQLQVRRFQQTAGAQHIHRDGGRHHFVCGDAHRTVRIAAKVAEFDALHYPLRDLRVLGKCAAPEVRFE